jgi:KRAB domain-containing zinc finger protein
MEEHRNEHIVPCNICSKTFTSAKHLGEHIRTHSEDPGVRKPFVCQVCRKSYAQKSYLKQHMLVHTAEKPHVCKLCGKSFAFKCALVTHMNSSVHNLRRPVLCVVCDKDFATKHALRLHVERKHADVSQESLNETSRSGAVDNRSVFPGMDYS